MSAPLRVVTGARWLRVRPSGHVHYFVIAESGHQLLTACDQWRRPDQLTEDYPPLATRCPTCLATIEDRP